MYPNIFFGQPCSRLFYPLSFYSAEMHIGQQPCGWIYRRNVLTSLLSRIQHFPESLLHGTKMRGGIKDNVSSFDTSEPIRIAAGMTIINLFISINRCSQSHGETIIKCI